MLEKLKQYKGLNKLLALLIGIGICFGFILSGDIVFSVIICMCIGITAGLIATLFIKK